MTRAVLALALAAILIAGCGDKGAEPAGPPKASALVDFSKQPPYVNTLEIDPADGSFLLTTNRGFFRIDPATGAVERIRGRITADGMSATVGTFLELKSTGPGRYVGSGHPDQQGTLPSFLGFIRSDDGGKSWSVVSRLGDADLHKIVLRHDRLYAFDAVLSAILISFDGGRTFSEHFTPRGLVIDFEVDPADPQRIVAANEAEIFQSRDGGESWRPLGGGEGIRLAWPAPDVLLRADRDGTVRRSRDGGQTFDPVGKVAGEPYKFKAVDAQRLYLALSDGTILETRDGGATWKAVFRP